MNIRFSFLWLGGLLLLFACQKQAQQTAQSHTAETERRQALMDILPNSPDVSAVETLVDVLEKTDEGAQSPLAGILVSNSATVQTFAQQVDVFLANPSDEQTAKVILRQLRVWEANHRPFLSTIQQNPSLSPHEQMSKYLSVISNIGTKAVHAISNQTTLPTEEHIYYQKMLDLASETVKGTELAVVEPIRRLIEEASPES